MNTLLRIVTLLGLLSAPVCNGMQPREICSIVYQKDPRMFFPLLPVELLHLILGMTPLHRACNAGDLEAVKGCLGRIKSPLELNARDIFGRTPFYVACERGHHDIAELLFAFGVAYAQELLTLRSNDGLTPFFVACANGHSQVVQFLLKLDQPLFLSVLNSKVRSLLSIGETASFVAAQNDIIRKMLDHELGAVHNIIDIKEPCNGEAPLFVAARNGHNAIVKLLLDQESNKGAAYLDLNARDFFGRTPFYVACERGHHDIAELLFTACADYAKRSNDGLTPFFASCANGHYQVVEFLLKCNHYLISTCEEPLFSPCNGQTPLFIASTNGHFDIVDLLLDQESDKVAAIMKPCNGVTSLSIVRLNGHTRIVELFLRAGCI